MMMCVWNRGLLQGSGMTTVIHLVFEYSLSSILICLLHFPYNYSFYDYFYIFIYSALFIFLHLNLGRF